MTARGTLYVNEDWGDKAQKELDEVFGKNRWRLDGSEFAINNESNLSEVIEIPIMSDYTDEEGYDVLDERVGTLVAKNKFSIEEQYGERYVEIEPESFKIIDLRKQRKR